MFKFGMKNADVVQRYIDQMANADAKQQERLFVELVDKFGEARFAWLTNHGTGTQAAVADADKSKRDLISGVFQPERCSWEPLQ
jgi:hypothetical protein